MLKFLFILICLLSFTTLYAQQTSNMQVTQQVDNVVITYDISSEKSGQTFDIKVECSSDGGKTYSIIPQFITGDIKGIAAGNKKQIIWNVLNERQELVGDQFVFQLWAKENNPINSYSNDSDNDKLILIGKSYFNQGEFQKADSIFSKVIVNQPDNIRVYVYLARTASCMDPTSELGLAKPKFELLIEKISNETKKYDKELQEAFTYLGYYYLLKKDYPVSKSWYKRMYELDASNKQWQIQSLKSQALLAYREKKYVEARDCYIEIKKLNPADPDAKKAIQDLSKAIRDAQ